MIDVKHKPASPLPWRAERCPCGQQGCSSSNVRPATYGQGVMQREDAAYAAHAANAYRLLVAALRETSARLRGAAHDMRVEHIDGHSYKTIADQERAWSYEKEADEADNLLRELDEEV